MKRPNQNLRKPWLPDLSAVPSSDLRAHGRKQRNRPLKAQIHTGPNPRANENTTTSPGRERMLEPLQQSTALWRENPLEAMPCSTGPASPRMIYKSSHTFHQRWKGTVAMLPAKPIC